MYPTLDWIGHPGVGCYGLVTPVKLASATQGAAALAGLNGEDCLDEEWCGRVTVGEQKDVQDMLVGPEHCSETRTLWFIDDITSAAAPAPQGILKDIDQWMHQISPLNSSEFLCPISLCVMTDPVIAGDSITYERSSIERWLKAHGTSPHTRQVMNASELTPNRALLASIQSYRKLAEQMAEVKASLCQ